MGEGIFDYSMDRGLASLEKGRRRDKAKRSYRGNALIFWGVTLPFLTLGQGRDGRRRCRGWWV